MKSAGYFGLIISKKKSVPSSAILNPNYSREIVALIVSLTSSSTASGTIQGSYSESKEI